MAHTVNKNRGTVNENRVVDLMVKNRGMVNKDRGTLKSRETVNKSRGNVEVWKAVELYEKLSLTVF